MSTGRGLGLSPKFTAMAKSFTLHPEVITRDYKGIVIRFRNVDGDIYMPVKDLRDFLNVGYSQFPIYQICASSCKIEFYLNGSGLTAILPWDIENLVKGGMKHVFTKLQEERILWLKETCKILKAEERAPENALKIFSNPNFGEVRTQVHNGEPMFCLSDVCKAIDIANPRNVKSRLDKEDVHQMDTLTSGGNQLLTYITESGLYDAILRSDSTKAKPFRKWVTKEVLPSIRKTGGYVVATPDDSPEIVMARGLMAAKEALDRMEQRALNAESSLQIAAPKAEYYDAVVTDRELFTTTQVACELGMCYKTLRTKLVKAGIVTKHTGILVVNPDYENWGERENRTGRTGRSDFKWNRVGRDSIFNLIDPNMPK